MKEEDNICYEANWTTCSEFEQGTEKLADRIIESWHELCRISNKMINSLNETDFISRTLHVHQHVIAIYVHRD